MRSCVRYLEAIRRRCRDPESFDQAVAILSPGDSWETLRNDPLGKLVLTDLLETVRQASLGSYDPGPRPADIRRQVIALAGHAKAMRNGLAALSATLRVLHPGFEESSLKAIQDPRKQALLRSGLLGASPDPGLNQSALYALLKDLIVGHGWLLEKVGQDRGGNLDLHARTFGTLKTRLVAEAGYLFVRYRASDLSRSATGPFAIFCNSLFSVVTGQSADDRGNSLMRQINVAVGNLKRLARLHEAADCERDPDTWEKVGPEILPRINRMIDDTHVALAHGRPVKT